MSAHSEPLESVKDKDNHEYLSRMETAGSVVMTKELFEKLYLSPQTKVSGDLRKTFGNPTPLYSTPFIKSPWAIKANTFRQRSWGILTRFNTLIY